ncbi:MAG TPA: PepSY domain-containing protein [Candidatus Binatia bacterium]|nr:PepSY domain-containing protein [Candidatus Binatia bacterium]
MKLRNIICSALVIGLFAGCASEKGERGEDTAKLQAQAKVTKGDAEKIALAKVPNGTIKEGGIEKEKGKLIWSFDIATPGTKDITEVAVDAITGEVVAVDKETPGDEAKEKKKEKEDDEKSEKK